MAEQNLVGTWNWLIQRCCNVTTQAGRTVQLWQGNSHPVWIWGRPGASPNWGAYPRRNAIDHTISPWTHLVYAQTPMSKSITNRTTAACRARRTVISMSVCMFVCPSAGISKTGCPNFTKFSVRSTNGCGSFWMTFFKPWHGKFAHVTLIKTKRERRIS